MKATVVNEQWLVQGRRGTNPFKSKSKIKKGMPEAKITCEIKVNIIYFILECACHLKKSN